MAPVRSTAVPRTGRMRIAPSPLLFNCVATKSTYVTACPAGSVSRTPGEVSGGVAPAKSEREERMATTSTDAVFMMRHMLDSSRSVRRFLLLVGILAAAVACHRKPPFPPDVIARVGERMVTLNDFKRYLDRNA